MKELIQNESLSPEALAVWSAPYFAYVKQHEIAGEEVYAIFATDGAQLGVCPSREIAFVAARQHDLEPLSVH